MVGIDFQGSLVYKCVKDVVIHRRRKGYSFAIGKTYPVTKKEIFDGSGVYTYLIKHPEKELFIAPLFLDSFFSEVEREEANNAITDKRNT